ncbi:MAG: endonuclease/exonuclease/phosphatase family metal-dependent hydrolase [Oleiphilaceae bacterium]|jgi:endonuclease/exonuclease/phosphatase family metal-dependent hydrolase
MYQKIKRHINQLMSPLSASSQYSHPDDLIDTPFLDTAPSVRLLTFNIQVGISTSSYRHYLTKSWQHVLPHRSRQENLDKIAAFLSDYDMVALQEVDGGSLRSGFINQVEYLATEGNFPYWYQQLNRNFGPVAKHSNGLLSRYRPFQVDEYSLPGRIPGRGVILAQYGKKTDPLVLVIMHLSLSDSAQRQQLSFVRALIDGFNHVVLMGDMNTHAEKILHDSPLEGAGLVALPGVSHTFPSWRPEKALDHILISRGLLVKSAEVVAFPVSDHLPIALEFALPDGYHR